MLKIIFLSLLRGTKNIRKNRIYKQKHRRFCDLLLEQHRCGHVHKFLLTINKYWYYN